MKNNQHGIVLIEILVSLVIFVLGIVGVLGSVAATARFSGDNRFRAEAVNIADELLGQMAVSKTDTLKTSYASGSGNFTAWKDARVKTLPNGDATITFPGGEASANGVLVQLKITWLSPNAKPDTPASAYTTTTYFP
jgi:type IV pilus assembly protein PilV